MQQFLRYTAWEMEKPKPFGLFHVLMLLVGISICIGFAYRLRHVTKKQYVYGIFGISLVLLILELYKQLFHFYLLDDQQYDWWIFPFQLCSLPMYIGILFPFLKDKWRTPLETFLMDFSLLGAVMALLFPDDLMHRYVMLTAHAFLWHFLLLFLSLWIGFHKQGDTTTKGFLQTLPLFFMFAGIATFLNIALHTLGELNMFYISPYYESTQPFFNLLTPIVGISMRNLIYLFCILLGAWLIHLVWRKLQKFL